MKYLILLSSVIFSLMVSMGTPALGQEKIPLRIGVAGLTHAHVHWILGSELKDIELVGIAEPNRELAERFAKQHGYSMDIVYSSLEEMLDKTKPEAVTAFNDIYGHLEVVQICAPRRVHVMVEKPLAVSVKHAEEMAHLARANNIQLLTNYETTWYATHHELYKMVHEDKAIGDLRKVVIHDGHPGPIEIGCNAEFLEWLTDPVLNGGGAVTDFGCYGANLMTWLMKGQRPTAVFGVTQQIKPDKYPKVDDEATIVLTYPKTQGIVQASWNWPVSRKDMHVYGQTGYVFADNRSDLRTRLSEKEPEETQKLPDLRTPYHDPFAYLAGVIRGTIKPEPYDLSSLENNLIVVEILEAARKSAKKGKRVELK